MTAFQQLENAITQKNSYVVLGLDPTEEMEPDIKKHGGLKNYLTFLIDQTHENIVGIKPNLAFYEETTENRQILSEIMDYAAEEYGLLKILDVKRGDIMDTQSRWAKADIANFKPDIITLNEYMGGLDVIKPYLDADENMCVFALTATSNPGAREFQDAYSGGIRNYQKKALQARRCDKDRVGFVVGATKPDAMKNIRAIELEHGYEPAFVLAPGFGKQGGSMDFVNYTNKKCIFPISSGLTKEKYLGGLTPKEASLKWKNEINEAMETQKANSLFVNMIEEMVENDLLWTAPEEDTKTWRRLNNGSLSPIYADIRNIQSHPDLMKKASYLLAKKIKELKLDFDHIAAVPYGSLGLAYGIADILNKPVLTPRKEGVKDHGDKKEIVGKYKKGDIVLIFDDVATSGKSIIEASEALQQNDLIVNDALVLVDRQQGAAEHLANHGINLDSRMTLLQAFTELQNNDNGKDKIGDFVIKYLKQPTAPKQLMLTAPK